MSSSSQEDVPAPQPVDDIDEQWEKFAKDGCPDWWLMAKYTHGWLARTFPYVPFKDRAAALSGDAAAAGAPALASAGSLPTPAAAAGPPAGRSSHSSPEMELLPVAPASQKASGSAQQQQLQEEQQPQLRSRAVSLDSARDATAADDNAATPSAAQQQQNCGNPLKGLFACRCAAPAGVDKPVDEVHS